ncbi:MAG: hypothetical protein JRG80_11945 [Deltaproteobacteria bacterium]|nr:hypothetical protein [Deltaproteobacteria bacterium]MBW2399969.1 hypothetical protein [Deltaproteobacteria bacterium]MBW2667187.1 hypothetical protein [Deltaproteobacteria bacterium]
MCRIPALCVWALSALLFATTAAEARPERIRAGHSYYSDDFSVEGVVRDLSDEKNYEEVYQAYRYYEAVYDDRDRVVSFKQIERGEVVREDRYRYTGDAPVPVEHIVEIPGRPPVSTQLDPPE